VKPFDSVPELCGTQKVHCRTPKTSPHISILRQSSPVHTTKSYFYRFIFILSTYLLRLGLPSGPFPSGFPTILPLTYMRSSSPLIRATLPAYLTFLDLTIILGEEYKSRRPSLCSFLHTPVTSSLLAPNILLSTLFSNTLSPCSSLYVGDQVSGYRTTGKIIILCILTFRFLDNRREDRQFSTE
jgi:hypothetical protein